MGRGETRDYSTKHRTVGETVGKHGPARHEGGRLQRAVYYLEDHTRQLWWYAILLFVIGDFVTTVVGLESVSVVEAGPVAGAVLAEYGLAALVPMKVGFVAFTGLLWWVTPRPHDVGVPLGLAVLGGIVTVWNAVVVTVAAVTGTPVI